ncbi:MAG: glucosamine-6-phosphate deaminase [Firmicutes bacterium]|nr:glucosamine-6-phosphate deaminase [Bacillota bacterium]
MRTIVVKDYVALSKCAAVIVAGQIMYKPDSVLGLPTGSTPEGTYKNLVDFYKEGLLDFSRVVTFNLDEYYGLGPQDKLSYHWYMHHHLFAHVNIDPKNVHIPNGLAEDVEAECRAYEEKIDRAGGIDLQLLGIGRNGHIGFNEPGTGFDTLTRMVRLTADTIAANARFFASPDQVPVQAISMGIKSIMKARRIVLLASGSGKAQAVRDMVLGAVTPEMPASVLQLHPDVTVIVDREAARLLD